MRNNALNKTVGTTVVAGSSKSVCDLTEFTAAQRDMHICTGYKVHIYWAIPQKKLRRLVSPLNLYFEDAAIIFENITTIADPYIFFSIEDIYWKSRIVENRRELRYVRSFTILVESSGQLFYRQKNPNNELEARWHNIFG